MDENAVLTDTDPFLGFTFFTLMTRNEEKG